MKLPILSNVPAIFDKGTRWLEEFKNAVVDSFKTVHDYDVLYVEPDKLKIGMVRYFGAAVSGTTIAYAGLWQYTAIGWKEVGMAATRYNDYIVPGIAVRAGATAPDLEIFRGTLYQNAYAVGEYAFFAIHILHDIKKGSTPTFHVHWSHKILAPGTANVKWAITYSIARGYSAGTFPAERTLTVQQAVGAQYVHHIAGDDAGMSMHADDVAILEPDCLLLGRIERVAASSHEFAKDAFCLQIDMHYEVGQFGTVERNRGFTAEGFDA